MRSRASVLLAAVFAAGALAPAVATAAPKSLPGADIKPYKATIETPSDMTALNAIGYDLHESGYDKSDKTAQDLALFLQPTEAAKLRAAGLEVEAVEVDAAEAKDPTLGDSPNPYFNV